MLFQGSPVVKPSDALVISFPDFLLEQGIQKPLNVLWRQPQHHHLSHPNIPDYRNCDKINFDFFKHFI